MSRPDRHSHTAGFVPSRDGSVSLARRVDARVCSGFRCDSCQGNGDADEDHGPEAQLRVSLRLAMVMIVVVAIPLARLAVRARAQKEAVAAIAKPADLRI